MAEEVKMKSSIDYVKVVLHFYHATIFFSPVWDFKFRKDWEHGLLLISVFDACDVEMEVYIFHNLSLCLEFTID